MLEVWCGKWKKYVVQEITNILNSKTTTTISYPHLYKDEWNGNGSNANELLVGNIPMHFTIATLQKNKL